MCASNTPPLALDLCCGLGGWAAGLIAAGFDVVGVDIEERFRATYPGWFLQGDVIGLSSEGHLSIKESRSSTAIAERSMVPFELAYHVGKVFASHAS